MERITSEQYVVLLNTINPYDKQRAKRVLMELDLDPKSRMTFQQFAKLHAQFPTVLHPAFKFQLSMREKTMGERWWVNKLLKYKQVRTKIDILDNRMQELASAELGKLEDNEQRMKRIRQREKQIYEEANPVRRTLLQARQFLDEVQT